MIRPAEVDRSISAMIGHLPFNVRSLPVQRSKLDRASSTSSSASPLLEILMREHDRHCPLADGRSDAFGRAGPHVPRREYPGMAGLQQERWTPGGPVARLGHVSTGPDEPPGVSL